MSPAGWGGEEISVGEELGGRGERRRTDIEIVRPVGWKQFNLHREDRTEPSHSNDSIKGMREGRRALGRTQPGYGGGETESGMLMQVAGAGIDWNSAVGRGQKENTDKGAVKVWSR